MPKPKRAKRDDVEEPGALASFLGRRKNRKKPGARGTKKTGKAYGKGHYE